MIYVIYLELKTWNYFCGYFWQKEASCFKGKECQKIRLFFLAFLFWKSSILSTCWGKAKRGDTLEMFCPFTVLNFKLTHVFRSPASTISFAITKQWNTMTLQHFLAKFCSGNFNHFFYSLLFYIKKKKGTKLKQEGNIKVLEPLLVFKPI